MGTFHSLHASLIADRHAPVNCGCEDGRQESMPYLAKWSIPSEIGENGPAFFEFAPIPR